MRTTVFDSVIRKQTVNFTCTRCGKKKSKVVKTEHTINPFNKNTDGYPKSRQEVSDDVRIEQAKRVAEVQSGGKCNKCKDEIIIERRGKP